MKKTLGILAAAFAAIVMAISMIGCSDTSALQSDIDRLTDTVADLTEDNENLTDKVNSLNVFTSDKAEYSEHETMTVYFRNQPVLKIRIDFDNTFNTALWGAQNELWFIYNEYMCGYLFRVYCRNIVCCQ